MLQSFETTGPPGQWEFNTDQVLKNINSPAPGQTVLLKPPHSQASVYLNYKSVP
jgi:hypothetical protein